MHISPNRQIVLDTETTGLKPGEGHRIIEVGAVELVDGVRTGKTIQFYINPERKIPKRVIKIHGITDSQVADKPTFGEVAGELLDFLDGAELVIHHAPFDVQFLNIEFVKAGFEPGTIENHCKVFDTLTLARQIWPRRSNKLDDVCKRVGLNPSGRKHHGALLDAELLTDAYIAMLGVKEISAMIGRVFKWAAVAVGLVVALYFVGFG